MVGGSVGRWSGGRWLVVLIKPVQNLYRSHVSWKRRMMQKLKNNALWFKKFFGGLLLTKVYIMFKLKKYRWIMFGGTEYWCQIEWKLTCAFKNGMKNLANFYRLKNNHFNWVSKMAKLNQNQNSKQPDRPNALWKLYFTLEITE